ncbi:13788_t:CDS:2 [Dentiscutata erythropus]|uniref:13788_t:CDS:1 n=1 Tax=Dentiscutata erythropus TaxID=1348616 RepID=A0A9N9AF36_9GLOM|nr:13788_t:CDS:2 [Dentiscutata erythropus]
MSEKWIRGSGPSSKWLSRSGLSVKWAVGEIGVDEVGVGPYI